MTDPRRHQSHPAGAPGRRPVLTLILLALLGCALSLPAAAQAAAASAPDDVLATVNGIPITAGEMDALIMDAHRSRKMTAQSGDLVQELLDKRVQDILFIQDALAAEMDQEESFVRKSERRAKSFMIQEYVKDHLQLPDQAEPSAVKAFFDRNYGQVQLRQLSVRNADEATRLREAVVARRRHGFPGRESFPWTPSSSTAVCTTCCAGWMCPRNCARPPRASGKGIALLFSPSRRPIASCGWKG